MQKITTILLIAFLNISCKKEILNNKTTSIDSAKIIQKINRVEKITDSVNKSKLNIKSNGVNWIFNKLVPISNTYSCDSKKYQDFNFSISNDSVFISGIYTDNVYRGIIKTENYFSQKYL
ncbi:hypothetical protein SL053_002301, partial [Flavobacterium psychrophilum]|nr:hypothetical protein [Flavobacterium psychrophilum]